MKRPLTTLSHLAAAALALAVAGSAAAQAGPGPGRGPGRGMARIMDALSLTDAQRQKVQPLLDDHRTAVQGLHEKVRSDRQALRSALQAAQPDAATVGKAMLALKADRDAMKAQRDALHGKLAKVLTPEQNAKLDGFIEGLKAARMARGAGMGMRRGGMGMGGAG